jgi:hypothetical protein
MVVLLITLSVYVRTAMGAMEAMYYFTTGGGRRQQNLRDNLVGTVKASDAM